MATAARTSIFYLLAWSRDWIGLFCPSLAAGARYKSVLPYSKDGNARYTCEEFAHRRGPAIRAMFRVVFIWFTSAILNYEYVI
ncbi:hypothetical protein AGR1A_Cc40078 [Agrobacterium fabacearum CFBP 5771]|nr:hypothetical protein AGR1A_Cc40078 [Agrobacterium fabacearum CFBP 5771]